MPIRPHKQSCHIILVFGASRFDLQGVLLCGPAWGRTHWPKWTQPLLGQVSTALGRNKCRDSRKWQVLGASPGHILFISGAARLGSSISISGSCQWHLQRRIIVE